MDILYTTSVDGTHTTCFAVNDYVSCWVIESETAGRSLVLGYHPDRTDLAVSDAKKRGITWTTDLPKLFALTEKNGEFDGLAEYALNESKSSHMTDAGHKKYVQVLYHVIYKRKVQITDTKTYIRMPLPVFNKMVATLRAYFTV